MRNEQHQIRWDNQNLRLADIIPELGEAPEEFNWNQVLDNAEPCEWEDLEDRRLQNSKNQQKTQFAIFSKESMNEKTKEQTTIQTILAMRNALDQPGTDVDEHASLHLISAGPMFSGARALFDFSGQEPNWHARAMAAEQDRRVPGWLPHLDFRYDVRARMSYLNTETGRLEEHPLTDEQQRTADEYGAQTIHWINRVALEDTGDPMMDEAMDEQSLAEVGGSTDKSKRLKILMPRTIRMAGAMLGEAMLSESILENSQTTETRMKYEQAFELLVKAEELVGGITWGNEEE